MTSPDAYGRLAEPLRTAIETLEPVLDALDRGDGLQGPGDWREAWEGFAREADQAGLEPVGELARFLLCNLDGIAADDPETAPTAGRTATCVWHFAAAFVAFVEAPEDITSLAALIGAVQAPDWPVPMDEDTANELLRRVLAGLHDEEDEFGEQSDRPALEEMLRPERLRLGFPEQTERQVIEAFLNEAPDLVSSFLDVLYRMAREGVVTEDILQAERLAHTIKGSANVTGVPAIATLMHACEDLLERLHEDETIDAATMDIAVEAGDCLAMQLDYLMGAGPAPDDTSRVIERLLQRHAPVADVDAGTPIAVEPTAAEAPTAEPEPEPETGPEPMATAVETLRIPLRLIDRLLRQAGEVSISNVQLQGKQQDLVESSRTLVRQQAIVRERLAALQNLVDIKSIPSARLMPGNQVVEDVFDPLELDQYNELHSVTHALVESIVDAQQYSVDLDQRTRGLGELLRQQDALAQELHEHVMSTRLVPVSTIRSRLERVVRQTVRQTGRDANFEMDGGDTLIDRNVLDQLTDPLLHVLRNAVDHGIEAGDERERLGKPATGTIRISVHKRGDSVLLRVSDDGRGLDRTRIRAVATAKGLLDDVSTVDETDVDRLILLPGFSTREETTQVSGRGIGMDVVQSRMKQQRGAVDIASEIGFGTTITLQVPITLSSMHALLVGTSSFTVAVPSGLIEQLIFSDFGEWVEADDGLQYLFEERTYHAVGIDTLLGEPAAEVLAKPEQPKPLMLIQGIGRNYAVMVDRVLGSQDVIIKTLGRFMPDVPGILGASILGDGGVAPVLDLRDILGRERSTMAMDTMPTADAVTDVPLVLVVDDSVSARQSLSALVADGGYRVVTAIDGLEAIEVMEAGKPAAIITDLEMPRMNGLEFTRHIRANDETSDIAVMMVTSRSTDKHHQHATEAGVDAYVVKPYDEDAILESLAGLIAARANNNTGAAPVNDPGDAVVVIG